MRTRDCLIVAGMVALACTASAAPLVAITNLNVVGGSTTLGWDFSTNRFIVEETRTLTTNAWLCTGSSTGAYARVTRVPDSGESNRFYRLQLGLQVVEFPDTNLTAEVRKAIAPKHPPTNKVYDIELPNFTTFTVTASKGIRDLTGLDAMRNLTQLTILNNLVSNASPLIGLTNLTYLALSGNQIRSMNLAGIPKLQDLYLGNNGMTNVLFLTNGAKLVNLYLPNNNLPSLVGIGACTNLTYLDASHNVITTVLSLTNVKKLQFLDLSYNLLTDLAPLVTNAVQGGLGAGDAVYVTGNTNLSSFARTNQIPRLQTQYGVSVFGP